RRSPSARVRSGTEPRATASQETQRKNAAATVMPLSPARRGDARPRQVPPRSGPGSEPDGVGASYFRSSPLIFLRSSATGVPSTARADATAWRQAVRLAHVRRARDTSQPVFFVLRSATG